MEQAVIPTQGRRIGEEPAPRPTTGREALASLPFAEGLERLAADQLEDRSLAEARMAKLVGLHEEAAEQTKLLKGAVTNLTNKVTSLTVLSEKRERHLHLRLDKIERRIDTTETDLGSVAGELGARAKVDSLHDEKLAEVEKTGSVAVQKLAAVEASGNAVAKSIAATQVEIVQVQRKLRLRDMAGYAVGMGISAGLYEGGKRLIGILFGH
jgi:chromosome segregation ATPase